MTDIPPRWMTGHHCPLGTGSGEPDGLLRRCPSCGRWWRKYTDYTFWAEPAWRPVRPWHFLDRKRIRDHERSSR